MQRKIKLSCQLRIEYLYIDIPVALLVFTFHFFSLTIFLPQVISNLNAEYV